MKKFNLWLLMMIGMVFSMSAQVTVPYNQGFEDSFTNGYDVVFISDWWSNIVQPDTLFQETTNVHSGTGALAAIPYGEEETAVDLLVQTTLDLTDKYNVSCSFYAATEETGGDKSVLLFLTTSTNHGVSWSPLVQIGNGETFPNADTPYAPYTYALPPSTNNKANVILRFVIRSGERRTPIAKLLIDDINIVENANDVFKPTIISSTLLAADSIRVIFSEPVDATAEVKTNYSFTPAATVDSVYFMPTQDTVYLKLAAPLEANVVYLMSINNIADLASNIMDPYEVEITYHVPLAGLVITEIFYDSPPPEMNDELEFIELYNASTKPISLEGLQLKEAIFSGPFPSYMLQPGEYWVMTMNNSVFQNVFGFSANYQWQASNLANDTDYLALYPAIEHAPYTLDSVKYTITAPWPTEGAGTGTSIELLNALMDNSLGENWVAATEEAGNLNGYTIYATPGKAREGANGPSVNLGQNGNRCGLTELTLDAGNAGSNYLWSTGEETQTILVTTSGTYSVIVNNGFGAAYDTIEVNFVPDITVNGTIPANACANTDVDFTDNSTDAVSWLWDFGDGNTSTGQNPKHTYTEAGTYTVSLTVENEYGCSDVMSSDVEVYPNAVDWTIPTLFCEATEAQFTDNSTNAAQWLWDFGDGNTSTDQNPVHTYAADGQYIVSLTITTDMGCSNTATQEITVHPNSIDWTLPAQICQHNAAAFADHSLNAMQWLWDFGDGNTSTDQSPEHTYANAGTYTVSLTVTNSFGCSRTETQEVTVDPNEAEWTLPANVCQSTAANFEAASNNAASWAWDFGDGNTSTDQNPAHTFAHAGTYTVMLTVTNANGCEYVLSEDVTVNPNMVDWTLPTNFCQNTALSFAENSANATAWNWDFGDGNTSTDQNPAHTYAEAGTYTLSLTVTNSFGCSVTETQEITVNPNAVSWSLPNQVCQNTAANFGDNSSDAAAWHWDFGDGNTSADQNPAHTYAEAGTYTVTLTVTNTFGCDYTVSEDIGVEANALIWTLPENVCTYNEVSFTEQGGTANSWHWDFGDGNSANSQNPKHSYSEPGEYTVSLTVNNAKGCEYTYSEKISVSICTGVEGTLNQSLSVYPNPSKGVLSVQLEAAYGEQAAVQLVNKMGQLVLFDSWTHQQGQVHSMDVSTLPSGLYLLRIYTESGTATRKVMIQR